MTEETYTLEKAHQKFAVSFFMAVWPYFENDNLSEIDKREMINLAHASHHHWLNIGNPINDQRGEWLIAKVYTHLEMPDLALEHAKRCLELTEKHDFKGFDLAYAYEMIARASALNKMIYDSQRFYKLAEEAGEAITKKEDKKMFMADLKAEPWFGKK